MPEKLGNGGNGPELYSEETGKYMADGKPNNDGKKSQGDKIANLFGLKNFPQINGDGDDYLDNFVGDSQLKEEYKRVVQSYIDDIQDEKIKNTVLFCIKNSKIKLDVGNHDTSFFDKNVGGDGKIVLTYDDFKNPKYFFHEFGHFVDFYMNKVYFKDSDTPLNSNYFSASSVSKLYSVIRDDFNKTGKNLKNDVIKIREQALNEVLSKNGFLTDKEKLERHQKELTDTESKYNELANLYRRKISGMSREEIEKFNNSEEAINLDKEYRKLGGKIDELKSKSFEDITAPDTQEEANFIIEQLKEIDKQLAMKYMNLSDTYSSVAGEPIMNGYGHHSVDYWNAAESCRTSEFFAEYFETITRGDTESLDMVKKYFPNACKIGEDLMEKIYEEVERNEVYGY